MRKADAQAWVKTEQKWFLTVMHTERRALHRAGRVDAVEALTRLITRRICAVACHRKKPNVKR